MNVCNSVYQSQVFSNPITHLIQLFKEHGIVHTDSKNNEMNSAVTI